MGLGRDEAAARPNTGRRGTPAGIQRDWDENAEQVLTALDPLGIGLKPHATRQISAEHAAAPNVYTPQVQSALADIRNQRDRPSAGGLLTSLNMDRIARSGNRSLRGSDPLSAAISLGRLAPSQAQVGQAGGRAMGAEEQRRNAILGGSYGRQMQFALRNALAGAGRFKAIDLANLGLVEDADAMMAQRAGIIAEQGAEAWGQRQPSVPSTDPLSEDFEWGSYTTDLSRGIQ